MCCMTNANPGNDKDAPEHSVCPEASPIGATIRRLRLNRSESLQVVARSCGVNKSHISQLEHGQITNPRADLIAALATHFQCSMDTLVGREDPTHALPADVMQDLSDMNAAELEFFREILNGLVALRDDADDGA